MTRKHHPWVGVDRKCERIAHVHIFQPHVVRLKALKTFQIFKDCFTWASLPNSLGYLRIPPTFSAISLLLHLFLQTSPQFLSTSRSLLHLPPLPSLRGTCTRYFPPLVWVAWAGVPKFVQERDVAVFFKSKNWKFLLLRHVSTLRSHSGNSSISCDATRSMN